MNQSTAIRSRNKYRGEQLRALAMPLGGLGTGSIALCGDGSLRQWQIHNQVNHLAYVPHSFFAIWVRDAHSAEPPTARVLQSAAQYDIETPVPPPTSNDHLVPKVQRQFLNHLPSIARIEFTGEYPIAQLDYFDDALPLGVQLEAFNPFIPLNSKDSGLPVILFQFTLTNPTAQALETSIVASLQNAVGWDGVAPIVDNHCDLYGANCNTLVRRADFTAIRMDTKNLARDAAGFGSMTLGTFESPPTYQTSWESLDAFWQDFQTDGKFDNVTITGPSEPGQTWNGALASNILLSPSESRTLTFFVTWHFPNRYVNFDQGSVMDVVDKGRAFRVGNQYNNWFSSALDVAEYVSANRARLNAETRRAHDVFYDTNLPPALIDAVASQISILRSPTCFWTEDGRFYGFEGCGGASTPHIPEGYGGSCPLNCTHVWNYEMALARLFPDLERTMRETEWLIQQHPSGYLPHRVLLPLQLPRPWERRIGGPAKPALDGLLGAILKTYREYLECGNRAWLGEMWASVKRALDYVWTVSDPQHSGIIEGEQPNTYDVSIYGANPFIGTLYLAALRVTAAMAIQMDEDTLALECEAVYERGGAELERRLWNGEYYIQDVDLTAHPEHNWATGCLSDQLLGQWWAHRLHLGHILNPNHIRTALDAILRYNFRENFRGHEQQPRVFVTDEDHGLLNCTWPQGGRPAVPIPYADEVWTGIEYQVAALLLDEGKVESALHLIHATRQRYDGRKQNPWNEIECGDHYVRALASWSLLEAALGYVYDAAQAEMQFHPIITPQNIRAPFFTRDGWGTFTQRLLNGEQVVTLTIGYGNLELKTLTLKTVLSEQISTVAAECDGQPIEILVESHANQIRLQFQQGLALHADQKLTLQLK
ncbi:MAG TPA: GH116 family glycosyl-hydrolase [Anaerolineae bacterium]|nr:GH116 family glycosyl-hydrolase [Anaerolineae bacterium]